MVNYFNTLIHGLDCVWKDSRNDYSHLNQECAGLAQEIYNNELANAKRTVNKIIQDHNFQNLVFNLTLVDGHYEGFQIKLNKPQINFTSMHDVALAITEMALLRDTLLSAQLWELMDFKKIYVCPYNKGSCAYNYTREEVKQFMDDQIAKLWAHYTKLEGGC